MTVQYSMYRLQTTVTVDKILYISNRRCDADLPKFLFACLLKVQISLRRGNTLVGIQIHIRTERLRK